MEIKITSSEIDDVICAEIPDADVDKDLHKVATKNMIHGVCSKAVIPNSGDIVVEVDEAINYPTKFLNSLDLPGMPPHAPQLKIDVPNFNQPKLCNCTLFVVKKLMSNVVEATILTVLFKCEDILIPRIAMIPTDMPFQFKRLQFLILLPFAFTINKAQGQSLELCCLHLDGLLLTWTINYILVGKSDNLYIYKTDQQKNCILTKEQAFANERTKERMAKMGTERHSARLEDARLRARRSCSVASDLLCSEQNERNKL
uniref:ATP-dependent DNA helicase n=1 Tax=Onchocerca volvulus TaxID=6282 RepID=A0A8R1TSM1_ONCVO